ncbi:nicotinamide mononucleotide transporter [Aliarcobacter vitoriensis]|uniref:Nicotinamide riboside transporter PnuC n=1 Tax=Aliarcobacter vitoriensis TaxID=2011099 RepID=A0A366MQ69_9BACT|nr:nicotinamide mononucleotide transporter [Aliarcobacter vitoriensis]
MDIFSNIRDSFLTLSYFELTAVFLSILYLLLAIRQNIWCWICAFFSTLIYTILFFDSSLFMSSLLNAYYLIMSFYGFYIWKYGNKENNKVLKISSLSVKTNFKIIISLSLFSLMIGYFMKNYTNASFAYLDSFITIFALATTFMMTRKILENWIYWIFIDSASIYLYFQKEFYFTSVLFLIYTILAIFAFITWKKEMKYEY